MPIFGSPLRRLFALRRTVRDLGRIATALEAQTVLLQRIADYFAPIHAVPTESDLKTTGPSFSRDYELALVEEFRDRFYRTSHREPTEEEVVEFLEESARPT